MGFDTVEKRKLSEKEKINQKIQLYYTRKNEEVSKLNAEKKMINEWESYSGIVCSMTVKDTMNIVCGDVIPQQNWAPALIIPEKWRSGQIIFNYLDKFDVCVDPELLPESIHFGSFIDLMIIGPSSDRYENARLEAIPSPIKNNDLKKWHEILKKFKEQLPIDAKIESINDEGIIFDIGCGIKTFCKTKFTHNKKTNDKIQVIVESIFERVHGEKVFNFQVQLYNLEEERGKYIMNKKVNKFILDTNVLIDYPELLVLLIRLKKQPIIVYNVLEELDGLKNSENEETRQKVYKSLELINDNINLIKFASPNFKYLPEGLDKNKNDNKLIAIALENKEQKQIIVSHDIGVLIKAKSQNIEVLDYAREIL